MAMSSKGTQRPSHSWIRDFETRNAVTWPQNGRRALLIAPRHGRSAQGRVGDSTTKWIARASG